MNHLNEAELNGLVDGRLERPASDRVLAHVLECDLCAGRIRDLLHFKRDLSRLPRETSPVPSLWDRVLSAVRANPRGDGDPGAGPTVRPAARAAGEAMPRAAGALDREPVPPGPHRAGPRAALIALLVAVSAGLGGFAGGWMLAPDAAPATSGLRPVEVARAVRLTGTEYVAAVTRLAPLIREDPDGEFARQGIEDAFAAIHAAALAIEPALGGSQVAYQLTLAARRAQEAAATPGGLGNQE